MRGLSDRELKYIKKYSIDKDWLKELDTSQRTRLDSLQLLAKACRKKNNQYPKDYCATPPWGREC